MKTRGVTYRRKREGIMRIRRMREEIRDSLVLLEFLQWRRDREARESRMRRKRDKA